MHDIVEFLRKHDPFLELAEDELEELSRSVEVEFFGAGETIFEQGAEPLAHVRVVRRGTVELVTDGRVFDELSEGELFGHPSALSGLPTEWAARAGEDALTYRLPAGNVTPLLGRPGGLLFLTRSLERRFGLSARVAAADPTDPAWRRVGTLLRDPPFICESYTPVSDAARGMVEAGAVCALVPLRAGGFGIVTDHDLRARVLAQGLPAEVPVSAAMTSPAFTVGPDRLVAEVMVEMLERGIRQVPVVSGRGEVLGLVTDIDVLAAETRAPFMLRRAVRDAGDAEALVAAARQLPATVIALHDSGVAPLHVSAAICAVADALIGRLVELAVADAGPPPAEFAWLGLGSLGRREVVPSSDIDSGLVWADEGAGEDAPDYLRRIARQVMEGLSAAGFAADTHGVTAAEGLFARSASQWRTTIEHWLEHPEEDKVLIAVSILLDARTILGPAELGDMAALFRTAGRRRRLMGLLLRLALAHRPPTGFRRNAVLEHSGRRGARLDIKSAGVLPVVDIARWASLAAGSVGGSTPERLRTAGQAGTLAESDAGTLEEACDLFAELRLEHQVDQLRAGEAPDDLIDPRTLNPLERRYLRDAFRAVSSVQRALTIRQTFAA
jgi:CBS domain-containing protein